jgi:hypothetical protein
VTSKTIAKGQTNKTEAGAAPDAASIANFIGCIPIAQPPAPIDIDFASTAMTRAHRRLILGRLQIKIGL